MSSSSSTSADEQCADNGIYEALTSPLMMVNGVTALIVGSITLIMCYPALKLLFYHNIYSNSIRILLIFSLFSASIHQITLIETRLRQFYRSIIVDNNRCLILYRLSECSFDFYFYYFSYVFSTCLTFSLTIDRIFSNFFQEFYKKRDKFLGWIFVTITIFFTIFTQFWMFYNVPRVGFVPFCYYPPPLTTRFDDFNLITTCLMICSFFITVFSLCHNIRHEKKIQHHVYDTNIRYNSYLNLMTSKSIFSVIFSQLSFILFSSLGVKLASYVQSESLFHCLLQFLYGPIYGNLFLPIIVSYQMRQNINRRRQAVKKMTRNTDDLDSHINRLKVVWK